VTENKGGAPEGNKNYLNGVNSTRALEFAIRIKSGEQLTPISRLQPLIDAWMNVLALTEDKDTVLPALKEVTDRLDGKPRQAIDHGGQKDNPVSTTVNFIGVPSNGRRE
jgi:hypothetical protein